jgi:hypothetical protein
MSNGVFAEAEQMPADAFESSRAKTATTVKEKKRGFIQKWFDKKIIIAAEHAQQVNRMKEQVLVANEMSRKERRLMEDRQLSVEPMRFSLYRANGGYVVETNMRNRNDRNTIGESSTTKLHIITDAKDLGEELAKIVTLENLRA